MTSFSPIGALLEAAYGFMSTHKAPQVSLGPGAGFDMMIPDEVKPYIPGLAQAQQIEDSVNYWSDYERNTGKKRRYPGMQTHTPDVMDPAMSATRVLDWWL